MTALPLDGLRVLAPTQLGAGPFAMVLLGDLGAEVVKVEDPGVRGDEARRVPPYAADDDSLYFQSLNRNAKSVTLNLRHPEGRRILHRLAARCDAVYNNLRGDLPATLGLDYKSLGPVNPRIVCCSLSGFGRTGPRAAEPAYDYLLQAYAGFMSLTGEPEDPPLRCGVSIVDFAGGFLSVAALMIGLHRAQRTGVGCDIDVSLLDTAVSMLNYLAVWALNRDYRPQRTRHSAHQTLVPSQNFRTRDGYVVVMCMKEKFWQRLCQRLGRPDLAADGRFRTFADRLRNRAVLLGILEGIFAELPTRAWLERLRGHVPCAPVCDLDRALRDEQVLSREMVVEVDHPVFGPLRQVGCPVKFDGVKPRYRRAPAVGEHTEEVLRRVGGLSAAEVAALRAAGAV